MREQTQADRVNAPRLTVYSRLEDVRGAGPALYESAPRTGKRARYRQRRSAALGPLAFEHAATGPRAQAIVAARCAKKAARLSHRGRANPYSTGAMRRFSRLWLRRCWFARRLGSI
jgi:hypothetical protein